MSKLTEDKVREIRASHDRGEPQEKIASRYGVCRATVTLVVNKQTWGWLDA